MEVGMHHVTSISTHINTHHGFVTRHIVVTDAKGNELEITLYGRTADDLIITETDGN